MLVNLNQRQGFKL